MANVSDPKNRRTGLPSPIEVYLDGATTPYKTVTGPPYRLELDTTAMVNGAHTLRIVQTDVAGDRQEQSYNFMVDNRTTFLVSGMESGGPVTGTVALDIEPQLVTAHMVAPADGKVIRAAGPNPWWYIAGTLVVFLAIWLFFVLVPTYSILVSGPGGQQAAALDPDTMAVGASLYGSNCAACHMDTGAGMGTAIPPLASNPALKDTDGTLAVIVHGAGAMQAFSSLDAQQLASVSTFVRNTWGNNYGAVSVDEAAIALGDVAPESASGEAEPAPVEAEPAQAEAEPEPVVTEPAQAEAEPAPAEAAPAEPVVTEPAQEAEPVQAEAEPEPVVTEPAQEAEPVQAEAEPEPVVTEPAQAEAEPAPAEAAPAEPAATETETAQAEAEPVQAEAEPVQAEAEPAQAEPAPAAEAPAAAAGSGEPRYVTTAAPLKSADGTALATITIGTEVAVTGDQGDSADVLIDGWSMDGAPSVIFLSTGQRIPLASLTDEGQQAREVVETKTDDYGTEWQHVNLNGSVASSDLGPDSGGLWSDGESLYAASCSACHALHSPDQFTANQWPGTLKSMLPMVSLTNEQLELMTKFLQYHAKDM